MRVSNRVRKRTEKVTQKEHKRSGRIKTEFQRMLERRNEALYREYKVLLAEGNCSRVGIIEYLQKKYDLHSMVTVYGIVNRMRAREEQEQETNAEE